MAAIDDPDALFDRWDGQIVPRTFNGGFVTLGYVVSLIGAFSTLELINRRTAPKGVFNHLLMVSAAVTMGGIAIWCMHYISNLSILMADGQEELQIAYSGGFTALSFFVPIGVLLAALFAAGTNNRVLWWRIAAGGLLAGAAICGMHYLGNESIRNYECIYTPVNVIGAAIIAVAASTVSLSLFFASRASWTNSWWKRGASSIVLAGAVSGMHWCASTGTQYKLVALKSAGDRLSRETTVIVVICLSISACCVIAGTMVYTATKLNSYAQQAQQVVLASAVFDTQGRVLVSADGLLPSEKITETFLEKNRQDSFSIAHPLFLWMFQASRNWDSINNLIGGMMDHLAHLPRECVRDASRGANRLTSDVGEPIDNYNLVLRELFCAAALSLAERLKSPLEQVGILWDEILPTGATVPSRLTERIAASNAARDRPFWSRSKQDDDSLAEKGLRHAHAPGIARGSLLFLVRQVSSPRDIAKLESAGFRFADPLLVSGIIAMSMQIRLPRGIHSKLRSMAAYANEDASALEPGFHLAFFGVRARVSVESSPGFDVLVRRGARNLLPSAPLTAVDGRLEPWQLAILQRLNTLNPMEALIQLANIYSHSAKEIRFAAQLSGAIRSLREQVDDLIFDEAMLSCKVFTVPCRPGLQLASSSNISASLFAFLIVVPIHHNMDSPKQEFIPLSLFKAHQLAARGSPHRLTFARAMHREISPRIKAAAAATMTLGNAPRPVHLAESKGRESHHYRRSIFKRASKAVPKTLSRLQRDQQVGAIDVEGNPVPTAIGHRGWSSPRESLQDSSVTKLWNGENRSIGEHSPSVLPDVEALGQEFVSPQTNGALPPSTSTAVAKQTSAFGGIMVSQEITVDVDVDVDPHDAGGGNGGQQRPHLLKRTDSAESRNSGVEEVSGVEPGLGQGKVPGGSGAAIEMKTFTPSPGNLVSNIEAGTLAEATLTFVDELFNLCVGAR